MPYRQHFSSSLFNGFLKLRTDFNTYALPMLHEIDMGSIFPMLGFVSRLRMKMGSSILSQMGDKHGLETGAESCSIDVFASN